MAGGIPFPQPDTRHEALSQIKIEGAFIFETMRLKQGGIIMYVPISHLEPVKVEMEVQNG